MADHPTKVSPQVRIERAILIVRGERVIVDAELAELYGVPTKRLNEQVKRNAARFPEDFMFPLSAEEKAEVVAICDRFAYPAFLRGPAERGHSFDGRQALRARGAAHT